MGKLEQATYSFGQHVVSGLGSFIPNLYWECHQIPVWQVTIDLLSDKPLPTSLHHSTELRKVTIELRDKFFGILAKHSTSLGATVSNLQISVEFPAASPAELRCYKEAGGYYFHAPPYICRIFAMGSMGKCYEVAFTDAKPKPLVERMS